MSVPGSFSTGVETARVDAAPHSMMALQRWRCPPSRQYRVRHRKPGGRTTAPLPHICSFRLSSFVSGKASETDGFSRQCVWVKLAPPWPTRANPSISSLTASGATTAIALTSRTRILYRSATQPGKRRGKYLERCRLAVPPYSRPQKDAKQWEGRSRVWPCVVSPIEFAAARSTRCPPCADSDQVWQHCRSGLFRHCTRTWLL